MPAATVSERKMAAKRSEDRRDDQAVKIERLLADKASFVSKRRKQTMAQYLSDILRGQVERDFAKETKDVTDKGKA